MATLEKRIMLLGIFMGFILGILVTISSLALMAKYYGVDQDCVTVEQITALCAEKKQGDCDCPAEPPNSTLGEEESNDGE